MANRFANKWRESSSLILLSRNLGGVQKPFDYNVLLFNRPKASSFMPDSWVFPGGVCEVSDASKAWYDHFKSFGICENELLKLNSVNGQRSSIFKKNLTEGISKEMSLRISAIRETFEEVGILLCRCPGTLQDTQGYGNYLNDFDIKYWQKLIHDDHTKFLKLCQEIKVVPDLWSLYEWSAWLTPAIMKKRFETAFFFAVLKDQPKIYAEEHEVAAYAWKSPLEYLKAAKSKEIRLPPPQYYELSRLLHFKKLEEAKDFANQRSNKGTVLMLPVLFKCTDGNVNVLPGDDAYPNNPHESTTFIDTEESIAEFRKRSKKLHRSEHFANSNPILLLNFSLENGHLPPISVR